MSFNFGGFPTGSGGSSSTPASAPAPLFGLHNSQPTNPASTNTGNSQQQNQNIFNSGISQVTQKDDMIQVPTYNDLLPGRSIWYKIENLVQSIVSFDGSKSNGDIDRSFKAGQELKQILNDTEAKDSIAQKLLFRNNTNSVLQMVSPDHALRQRMAQKSMVSLSIQQADGTIVQQEAALTPNMIHDICSIADDLMISEVAAISLYQQAASCDVPFRSNFIQSVAENSSVKVESNSVPWMAREIYYSQSSLLLHSCLSLVQNRLHESNSESELNPITEATDYLLQNGWIANLIQLVRDYTQRINKILTDNREGRPTPGMIPSSTPSHETSSHFWRYEVLLQTCFHERQLAVECLFFIAYHVQLHGDEIIAMIDLLRDLSNDCIILDPFTDVPDPMEFIPFGTSSNINFNASAPWLTQQPQREKDTLVWERELVTTAWKTGQPQLLRCSSIILVAIFSALNGKVHFMDRFTHVPNSIGVGNMLLPSGSTSIGGFDVFQKYLSKETIAEWKRPDVFGLVMASCVILLQSSAIEMSSNLLAECVETPLELKSFSFARLSLIPALRIQIPIPNDYANALVNTNCDVTEFFLSTCAEFASRIMDLMSTSGRDFISRAKWEQNAEEDLKCRREKKQQEQTLRGHFLKWSDPPNAPNNESEIPSSVDLLARPDCIDDIVAFATAFGVLGSNYALLFWSQETCEVIDGDEEIKFIKLVPSRAHNWLEKQQSIDDSLRPAYLSFLASLALAKNPSNYVIGSGADEVYALLRAEGGDTGSGWLSIFELFRWYIKQLNSDVSATRVPTASASSGTGSTAYYYLDQDENSGNDTGFGLKKISKSGEAVSQGRPRELGEANEFIVLSSLGVLANVASLSATARSAITAINLPYQESDGENVGQESALDVLFMLSVMPLSPDIRGSVFHTISMLLSVNGLPTGSVEAENIRKAAIKGWELLEVYQIVPINLLEQYPSIQNSSHRGAPNMSFPPSSSALAIGKSVQLWIPPDPRYSIIYELEFIESRRGHYPSTEGFLELLASLFLVGGSPSYLGQNWRARIGCTPYIEFVIDYVLPRITGHFERHHPLIFRSIQDRRRLRTLALNVVDIVLTSYHIPVVKPGVNAMDNAVIADDVFQASKNAAHLELGVTELAEAITIHPHADDIDQLMSDFFPVTATRPIGAMEDKSTSLQYLSQSQTSVPPAKSPGFSTLVRMLSSDRQMLFEAIIAPLIDRHNIQSIDVDALSLAYGLYVSTPPTFISAKDGARQTWSSYAKQSLLASLRPSFYTYDDTPIIESEVLSVLRILCGTLVKEDAFLRKMISSKGHATIVPILRFTRKASLPITLDVQLSKLSYLLVSSNIDSGIVSSIVALIGFTSMRHKTMNEIATMATAITFYIERSLSFKQALELLTNKNTRRLNGGLSEAFTTRLLVSAVKPILQFDSNLLLLIFDRLLTELRAERTVGSLTKVIFCEKITNLLSANAFGSVDAILLLLGTSDFAHGEYSASVATLLYETLYRLIGSSHEDKDVRMSVLIAEHLRARDFWSLEILKLCSTFQSLPNEKKPLANYHITQSIAWLFKGIACELRILAGSLSGNAAFLGVERLVASQPSLFKYLTEVLFSEQGLVSHALCVLPFERPLFTSKDKAPLDEKSLIAAKSEIYGSPDVVQGYATINFDKLYSLLIPNTQTVNEIGLRSWVEHWNLSVRMDCSSSHLSDAIRLVIETALVCSEDCGVDILSAQLEGPTTILRLLSCMMPLEDQMSNVESIDTTFFTTACRNIALAACAISLSIGDTWRLQNNEIDIKELTTLCSLISRIMACSVLKDRYGAEFTRIKTRLSALAGVLIPILSEFPNQVLDDNNRSYILQAATVIAELGVNVEIVNTLPITPSTEDLLLRCCLPFMLETLEMSTKEDGISPTRFVLLNTTNNDANNTTIRRIFKLLTVFDGSVASLTQRLIFISPKVGELFISTGILEALKNAAVNYFREEEKYFSLLTSSVNYSNAQIQIPFFLEGHFDVMSALMTSKVSPKLLHDTVPKIVDILVAYTPILDRLIKNFPVNGDTLRSMLCCMAQAKVLVNGEKNLTGEESVFTKDQISTIVNPNFSAFVSPVAKIVFHIAENPLPSQMLNPIPSRLSKPSMIPGIITLIEPDSTSWWDKRKIEATDADLDTAILGMELVKCGTLFLRHSESQATLDEFVISRAICRCTDAASRIESLIRSYQEMLSVKSVRYEVIKLQNLQCKIVGALEGILIVTLSQIRERKKDQTILENRSHFESYCRTIVFVLDYTRLDDLNFGSSKFGEKDENVLCFTLHLCRELRRELTMKSSFN